MLQLAWQIIIKVVLVASSVVPMTGSLFGLVFFIADLLFFNRLDEMSLTWLLIGSIAFGAVGALLYMITHEHWDDEWEMDNHA